VANDVQAVVDAVNDLTRVVIATQGNFGSKADVVRRLAELSIPPVRICRDSGYATKPRALRPNEGSQEEDECRLGKGGREWPDVTQAPDFRSC